MISGKDFKDPFKFESKNAKYKISDTSEPPNVSFEDLDWEWIKRDNYSCSN